MDNNNNNNRCNSPPETHSSDVSVDDDSDNEPLSETEKSSTLSLAAVLRQSRSETDTDTDGGGAQFENRSTPPDPPSQSRCNSASAPTPTVIEVVKKRVTTSSSSSIDPEPIPSPSPPSSSSSVVGTTADDATTADGADVDSLEDTVQDTNSYVEKAPLGEDSDTNNVTSGASIEEHQNDDQNNNHTNTKLIVKHEYSHSLVSVPSLDIMISPDNSARKEMQPSMEAETDVPDIDMDIDAATVAALSGEMRDEDAPSPSPSSQSQPEDDEEQEEKVTSSADPPASHEVSKSIVFSSSLLDSPQPSTTNGQHQHHQSPQSEPEENDEEIRRVYDDVIRTTPPPQNEVSSPAPTTNTTTTESSSRVSPDPLALPPASSMMYQKQPSGSHISETSEETQREELEPPVAVSANSNTSSRVSPPTINVASPSPSNKLRHQQELLQSPSHITYASPNPPTPAVPGRRSITLRLLEELPVASQSIASPLMSSVAGFVKSEKTPFRSLRRFRSLSMSGKALANITTSNDDGSGSKSTINGMPSLDEKVPSPTNGNGSGGNNNMRSGESTVDRGTIVVSWYEGTTSSEMQEHVFNCVLRKLNADHDASNKNKGGRKIKLEDVRLLDENVTPHGEVVLCPFLPDGSHFLLKFKTSVEQPPPAPKINHRIPNPYAIPTYVSRAPDSPSAEPSPHPSNTDLPSMLGNGNLNMNGLSVSQQQQQNNLSMKQQQRQVLSAVAALLQQQGGGGGGNVNNNLRGSPPPLLSLPAAAVGARDRGGLPRMPHMDSTENSSTQGEFFPSTPREEEKKEEFHTPQLQPQPEKAAAVATAPSANNKGLGTMEPISENSTTDELIEQQMKQLNALFSQRKSFGGGATPNMGAAGNNLGTMNGTANDNHQQLTPDDQAHIRAIHRDEKKQVIFVIANYLVLFMSLIALSAEIQSRLPSWMASVQENYDSVQHCATDQGALIECLSNGDFSGLVASFLLWATQSAAAKRIFLFGFDTPKKLWIVVYEALVSAVCWGTSYLFIRRGLNPNTRQQFLHKYWKDAVYGSLAGFNAAFMKAVLKNLVPQDVALEALEGRQLRIFHWLGSLMAEE